MRSEGQIQADIDATEAAMAKLIGGTRLAETSIGAKSYKLANVSYDDLKSRLDDLYEELRSVQGGGLAVRPVYHPGGVYPW